MPPAGKRKGERPRGDASDVTTDSMVGVGGSRRVDSEMSSTEDARAVQEKRPKVGSPVAARPVAGGGALSGTEKAGGGSIVGAVGNVKVRLVKKKKKSVSSDGDGPGSDASLKELKKISESLMELVMVDGVDPSLARAVMGCSSKYESLLIKILMENERLLGRMEAGGSRGFMAGAAASMPSPAQVGQRLQGPAVAQVAAPPAAPIRRPVETWAVVVKGKGVSTSEEVMKKVVKEVGPTLGVRVHDVRPIHGGGAIIRTPSVAERRKVAENPKFAEVGLEVSIRDKLGPKVIVQRVHPEISPDEFMREVYEMNLRDMMSEEVFKKSVRLVTGSWKQDSERQVDVILEVTDRVRDHLVDTGVYIKWFRFHVRAQDEVAVCYRCLGYDHMIRECKMRDGVCRRCGGVGHGAAGCRNDIRCRNCAFKGLPAGHVMLSSACPIYAARAAWAKARH